MTVDAYDLEVPGTELLVDGEYFVLHTFCALWQYAFFNKRCQLGIMPVLTSCYSGS